MIDFTLTGNDNKATGEVKISVRRFENCFIEEIKRYAQRKRCSKYAAERFVRTGTTVMNPGGLVSLMTGISTAPSSIFMEEYFFSGIKKDSPLRTTTTFPFKTGFPFGEQP